ncbi:MAG: nitroreductase/quinone reductase family protein [Anaerolineales bacterium]|nr:nitroreductase/quinone reductase family protein [Anaerolineales bacterium]
MSWILRSPFHSILSNGMMLITVTGHKTRKKYTLPVGYYRDGGYLWVLTSRSRTWWKNLRCGAKVDLLLKRELVAAFAEPELDERSVETQLVKYIHKIPSAARPLGIRVDNGQANAKDVARVAKERLFVRLKKLA